MLANSFSDLKIVSLHASLNVSTTHIINSLLRTPSKCQKKMMIQYSTTKQSGMCRWKSNIPGEEESSKTKSWLDFWIINSMLHMVCCVTHHCWEASTWCPAPAAIFLESRHLIICWTRCTIKLLRPNKQKQHNLKPKSRENESQSMTLNMCSLF